jgi:hypothetical protein
MIATAVMIMIAWLSAVHLIRFACLEPVMTLPNEPLLQLQPRYLSAHNNSRFAQAVPIAAQD